MKKTIAFLGATGAVGMETLKVLLKNEQVESISHFGRNNVSIQDKKINYFHLDVNKAESYGDNLQNCTVAVCTFGVGQPTKISKEEFIKIDKDAVLIFATKCKEQGVTHFELLASIGINAASKSYYLRTKGELVEELKKLNFDRLSIFQPSMILTPTNRYGFMQGVVLKVWPKLNFLLQGKSKKYRGIKVEELGKAIANNAMNESDEKIEILTWEDFQLLNK